MIPQKLIIEGVYSYKKMVEIDFTTLCKADLFGIFGNVGSGKSAILEAITYVLYGEAPRLTKSRLAYNMMNLTSSRMYIEFTFLQNDKQYLFNLEAKRKKKDFTVIDTPKRNAYVWEDSWLPLFDKNSEVSAEAILGLNYNNFRRTVIVPQGRFQEFLYLGESERRTMLMELFNLERFDLQSKISYLLNQNSQRLASVNGSLSSLPKVNKEILIAAEDDFQIIEKEIKALKTQIKKSDNMLRQYESLNTIYSEMKDAQAELEENQKYLPQMQEQKNKLALYEDCNDKFEKYITEIDKLSLEYEKQSAEIKRLAEISKINNRQLEEIESKLLLTEAENRKTDLMLKQVDWLKDISRLVQKKTILKRCKTEKEQILLEIKQQKDIFNIKQTEIDVSKKEANNIRYISSDIERISRIKSLYDEIEQKRNDYKKLQKQILKYENQLKEIGTVKQLDDELKKCEEELTRVLMQNKIAAHIKELAANLKDGQACPVCGALEHPFLVDASFSDETEKVNLNSLHDEKENLLKQRRLIEVLTAKIETTEESTKPLKKWLDNALPERDYLFKELSISGFSVDDKDAFDSFYKKSLEDNKKLKSLKLKIDKFETEQLELSKRIRNAEEKLSDVKIEEAGIESTIIESENKIDKPFLEEHGSKPAELLNNTAKQIENEVEDIKNNLAMLTEKKSSLLLKNESIKTEIKINEKHLLKTSNNFEKVQKILNKLISESEYNDLTEIKDILSQKIDIRKERNNIDNFEKKIIALKARSDAAIKQMDGRTYKAEDHFQEKGNNKSLKSALDDKSERRGAFLNRLDDLKRALKQKTDYENELAKLNLIDENLTTLKYLFKGKKFINYVATIYLKELCNAANSRFRKLTRESLRLELDEKNDFIIRDYLNDGKTRSVKTLSGGQTFQAAFSLALALADSIGKERSGFFFLDEGFGSLDKESLSLVFDSLKTLKYEDRTVGIISHVEELKQDIDTFITVTRDESGSDISVSW